VRRSGRATYTFKFNLGVCLSLTVQFATPDRQIFRRINSQSDTMSLAFQYPNGNATIDADTLAHLATEY